MKQEKVINSLIRFMKEENIYQTFVNSLKYYNQKNNDNHSLYDFIFSSSIKIKGEDAYNLFEWVFRLHIIKMMNNYKPTYFSIKDADSLGKLYAKKWEEYRKKIK